MGEEYKIINCDETTRLLYLLFWHSHISNSSKKSFTEDIFSLVIFMPLWSRRATSYLLHVKYFSTARQSVENLIALLALCHSFHAELRLDFRNSRTEQLRERWPWVKGKDGSGNTNSAAKRGTLACFRIVIIWLLGGFIGWIWFWGHSTFKKVVLALNCSWAASRSHVANILFASTQACCSNNGMKAQIKPRLLPGGAAEEQFIYRSDKCFFEWH